MTGAGHPPRHARPPQPWDRGPCRRVLCGHGEAADHVHGYNGRDYCGTCGPAVCPYYRPPGRRPCGRCGTPENQHRSLAGAAVFLDPDVCPWWVRPAPFAWLTRWLP